MASSVSKANGDPLNEIFMCTRPRKTSLSSVAKLRMSSGYNDIAGRPDERLGLSGSFTPGVHIVAGGASRDVPLEPEINPGTVLFTYPELKPDMSHEARINAVRPTERWGSRGSFAPGAKRWLGGLPRNVSQEKEIDHGTVLFTYPHLKPDMSREARTNTARPDERLGTVGSFTPPDTRRFLGGEPRDAPLEPEIDHGTVLFTYPELKPDMSHEARTNAVRPTERWGSKGSFTPEAKRWLGGLPRNMPLETEIDHGTILYTYPDLQPDTSGEARTNSVRPDERLGTKGSFTPGKCLHWRGGKPREIAREREVMHGTVLFPVPLNATATAIGEGREEDDSGDFFFASDDTQLDEEEVNGDPMQLNVVSSEDMAMFNGARQEQAVGGGISDGVFRRCGSDSKFPAAGADLMSGIFPAF